MAESRGPKIPWLAFVAFSLGMIVYGLAESYGPVTVASNVVPQSYAFLGYSLPYIFGGVGALISGTMADKVGRKNAFIITSLLIIIGLILYVPVYFFNYNNLPLLIVSMALVGTAAIGLEGPVLTAITESVDPRNRSKLLVLAPNFGNVGVALAFIPLLIFHNGAAIQERVAMMLMYVAPVLALLVAWLGLSETAPWIAIKEGKMDVRDAWKSVEGGNDDLVNPTASLKLRLVTLISIGVAQDVAFVYITYGMTYSYFSNASFAGMSATTLVPLLGGFIMTVVGVVTGLAISPRAPRKLFSAVSFILEAALWGVLASLALYYRMSLTLPVLIAFAAAFIPTELTWAARALLEPELFPTYRRGTYVSAVRSVVWILTGIITGIMTLTSVSSVLLDDIIIMSVVMLVGVGGALAWTVFGFETANKSLAGLDLKYMQRPPLASDGSKHRNS